MERSKAAILQQAIVDERGGKPEVKVLSEGDDDQEFWLALGGKPEGEIKSK